MGPVAVAVEERWIVNEATGTVLLGFVGMPTGGRRFNTASVDQHVR